MALVLGLAVIVHPATSAAETVFGEGFESGTLDGWAVTNDASADSGAASAGAYGVRLRGTAAIERGISTVGFSDVAIELTTRTKKYDSGEALTIEWFDGASWQLVRSVQDRRWRSHLDLLPASASDNAQLRLRISTNASSQ